ncbi:MAG: hypothetical protein CME62_00815 [Halobacteriovoraceae bacterium]|nr:hypothetical protein [Halobacteriovoraceae bacterium]|tara:strand:- start:730 stop:1260 length:531 start_codon:yes stop_codon:yes gene_type:complete
MPKHKLFDLVTVIEDENCNIKELIHNVMNSVIPPRHHFLIFKKKFKLIDIPYGYSLSSMTWDEGSDLFDILEKILERSHSQQLIFMDPNKIVDPCLFLELLRVQKLNNKYHPLNFDEPKFKDTCFIINNQQLSEIIISEKDYRGMIQKESLKHDHILSKFQIFIQELNFRMRRVFS